MTAAGPRWPGTLVGCRRIVELALSILVFRVMVKILEAVLLLGKEIVGRRVDGSRGPQCINLGGIGAEVHKVLCGFNSFCKALV